MATSRIPALKAALYARLAADSNLTGVDVTYGPPYPRSPERDWVWLGNATGTQETAAMGQRRREEVWTQDVVVSVVRASREPQDDVTERAFTIAGYVETSLRNWSNTPPYFDGVVREALVVATSLEEFVDDNQREGRVTITVACADRI